MKPNFLQALGEDLHLLIFSYLNANDLINLCYASKYYRRCILKKFDKYYNISTGFYSTELWTKKIEDNLWGLIENIYNDLIDNYFDFEWNYDNLLNEFHHLSLFSVCLHFLKCQKSCEKNYAGYCRKCSRVHDNAFYEYNAFLSVKVSNMDGYLSMSYLESVDFDVFLTQPGYFHYAFCESGHKCTHHEIFNYVHDLFAAFCSMYLNIAMKFFLTLISKISLVHEKKVIAEILAGAEMLLFRFFDFNYDFFYEFFDLFIEVNSSDCYVMFLSKPKYGPYSGKKYGVEVIMF